MGEFVRSPTCNQVLSTYDVAHVINFTRLSPFLSIFGSRFVMVHMELCSTLVMYFASYDIGHAMAHQIWKDPVIVA